MDLDLASILAIVLILLLIVFVLKALNYVFESLAVYQLAKNRGFAHLWLAWVPIFREWLIGKLIQGKLGSLPHIGVVLVFLAGLVSFNRLMGFFYGVMPDTTAAVTNSYTIFNTINLSSLLVYYIFFIGSRYKLFKIYAPERAGLYTLISTVIPLGEGVLLYVVRNRRPRLKLDNEEVEAKTIT